MGRKLFSLPILMEGQMDDFGRRLGRIRTDAGLSQTALASRVDMSQSAISQMEAGERKPSFDVLRQLAAALGVSPSYLLGEEIEDLSKEERVHFRQYRSLPDDARDELRAYAEFLRQKHEKKGR
jgi:transcriptional regulator with XRE-family HTH domain